MTASHFLTVGWHRRAVFGRSAPLSVDSEGRIHPGRECRDVCATRAKLYFGIRDK